MASKGLIQMVGGLRKFGFLACLVLALCPLPGFAQDNLDAGKTAAQLFASDCAICHKTPKGLAKSSGLFGLSGFLREHYTASRETASAIAAYLEAVGGEKPAERPRKVRRTKPKPKDDTADKPKSADSKPDDKKSDDKKVDAKKTDDVKPADAAKSSDTNASEPKPADSKPAEANQSDSAQAAGAKSEAPKASADKPADAKSDKKE